MVDDWPNGCCSAVTGKEERFGVKGDGAEEVTALIGPDKVPCPGSAVSNLVMARPLGTLPDPLAFLFFEVGPDDADGEVWRDRLRGVIVAEVVCEGWEEVFKLIGGGNCMLKFRCILCKSELECERRNGAMLPTGPDDKSNVPSLGKAPVPENICPSEPFDVVVVRAGRLCVL